MKLNPRQKLRVWLVGRRPCASAARWARAKDLNLAQAWKLCHRADWMVWAMEEAGLFDPIKWRRFACGCARMVWELLSERSRNAVEVAERFCDGLAPKEELDAAWESAWFDPVAADEHDPVWSAAAVARAAAGLAVWSAAWVAGVAAKAGTSEKEKAALLRKIYGNPFARKKRAKAFSGGSQ